MAEEKTVESLERQVKTLEDTLKKKDHYISSLKGQLKKAKEFSKDSKNRVFRHS